ncbi:MAG: class I SAM-dependent methyltransferase [Azovibrio sp.]|uniref:class I SAM-dependent methyltransferase n=1 Tax=Azovibrio sp. TaxID=1872673 RepID=UPI003C735D50
MPAYRHFALQAAAALLVFCLAWPYYHFRASPWNWGQLSLAIGAVALLAAHFARQPWWWRLIHGAFAPLLWLGLQLSLPPSLPLAIFLLLFLSFPGAVSGRIPLYLSSPSTAQRISPLLPQHSSLLDIGAGIGSLLLPLAHQRPDLHLAGIENAPLPWLLGKLRCRSIPRLQWQWGNFWEHPLDAYDTVYCFLSPAPMEALWHKARQEMRPGSLVISKAFLIPGIRPEEIREEGGDPKATLYIYRIPEGAR